jgi:hypothetical protein
MAHNEVVVRGDLRRVADQDDKASGHWLTLPSRHLQLVLALSFHHPVTGFDQPRPIRKGGNMAKVFLHMLFSDQADRNLAAIGIADGHTKHGLGHKNAFGMMAERSVPWVGQDGF